MSRANVTINFSYANLTTGRVTATPRASFIDVNGKVVLANIAYPTVAIASGNATIILPETEIEGVAYKFVIESGSVAPYTFIDEFDAIVKNVSPQNGNTLLTQFFSPDTLDTSIFNIADTLSKTPFIDRLAARIPGFNFKVFTNTQAFTKNDFTFRGDRFYQWIKTTSGTNIDPLTTGNYTDSGALQDGSISASASWQVASRSLVGSGVTTTDLAYLRSTFLGLNTQPASRKNLTELEDLLRATIATPDLTNYARKDQTNNFTLFQNLGAGGSVPNLNQADNSTSIANTATVRAIISSIGIGNLVAKLSIVEERLNQGISAALSSGVNVRQLSTTQRNGNSDIVSLSGGVVTIKAGTYLLIASAIANRCGGSKIYIYDNNQGSNISTRSTSSYTGTNVATSGAQNVEHFLFDVFTFSVNTPVTLRHIAESGGSDAGGIAANRPGFSELYSRLVLFRLD